jgi:hypothetical protein
LENKFSKVKIINCVHDLLNFNENEIKFLKNNNLEISCLNYDFLRSTLHNISSNIYFKNIKINTKILNLERLFFKIDCYNHCSKIILFNYY